MISIHVISINVALYQILRYKKRKIVWHPVVNISVHFDIEMRFIGENFLIVEWFALKGEKYNATDYVRLFLIANKSNQASLYWDQLITPLLT